MRFSEGRQSYLAHAILETLRKEGLAEVAHERLALQHIKRALEGERKHDAKLDEIVQRKIQSLSRKVPAGGREWDILYQRYMDEELRKQKK